MVIACFPRCLTSEEHPVKKTLLAFVPLFALMAGHAEADSIDFQTFVTGPNIDAAEGGNNSTIAFNYAGSLFVGSVYFGNDNNQLYSTSLTGGGVAQFGQPIPGFSGEVVVGAGLGQSGFAAGAIYAGNGGGPQIYRVPPVAAPTLFGSVPDGANVRQIFFDPGSTFGGNMLVTTSAGHIYEFNSSGTPSLVATIGFDIEGMDIASSNFGPFAGDLLVTSEVTGEVYAVSAGGSVTPLLLSTGGPLLVSEVETISTVPTNLGASGNPLEGFYVANYPLDVLFAPASNFAGLQGDAIVTEEFGSNSQVFDIHYTGNGTTDQFSLTQFTQTGVQLNQSEDGIFVTAQRITDVGVPEPLTLSIFGAGLAGAVAMRRRHRKAKA
jgi:hypothetical protein